MSPWSNAHSTCRRRTALAEDPGGNGSSPRPLFRCGELRRRWYLVGWDVARADWRTFRVDRIKPKPTVGDAFPTRTPPPDVAAKIERGIAYAPFAHRITLRLEGPVALHSRTIRTWGGLLESDGDRHSLLRIGADSLDALVAQVVMVGRPAEVVEGHALVPALVELLRTASETLRKLL